uniref:Uncharacterized protein n=1 Tax=Eutreptiella gymnastica TaxID=73025 RepID=A0A7S4FXI1_9EUGL|mmetsp:Transcript_59167/g.98164  ORF Transcript_59167/g.98164 Transcript_59167/m.98164 type:complete len:105 (-) Transcript_59167:129-443(-)
MPQTSYCAGVPAKIDAARGMHNQHLPLAQDRLPTNSGGKSACLQRRSEIEFNQNCLLPRCRPQWQHHTLDASAVAVDAHMQLGTCNRVLQRATEGHMHPPLPPC